MKGNPLPDGQYVSLIGNLRLGKGGQTRALLMRNRLFAQRAGVSPIIVTFDKHTEYDRIRAELLASGELVDGVRLTNIYDWHAEQDVTAPSDAPALPDPPSPRARQLRRPDGTVFLKIHPHGDGLETVDLYRPDGTVFVRQLQFTQGAIRKLSAEPYVPGGDPDLPVTLVDRQGRVVRTWATAREFRQDWVKALVPGTDRVFVISDSRFVVPDLVDMDDDRFHLLNLMHNPHVLRPWRWNSRFALTYVRLMTLVDRLDGLVSLTERQREAVAERLGQRTNLFVVPNPVESPPVPADLPDRDRDHFVVVARLDAKKQVEHAVRAFAQVVAEEPGATLDIYGNGDQQAVVEAEIAALGLQGSVTMRGFDPRARNATWRATAFLMTSTYEGYPLATLESMSHGCPVISYDITYGPREQITDGVDGFLVDPDDVDGFARRMLQLVRDPELVAKMSAAALHKAAEHDHDAFLEDWRQVLEAVADNKARRVTIESVEVTGLRPVAGPVARLARIGRRFFRAGDRTSVTGEVVVHGTGGPAAGTDGLRLLLTATSPRREVVVDVPLEVRPAGLRLPFTATVDRRELTRVFKAALPSVSLRLRLVWENQSWEAELNRDGDLVHAFERSEVAALRTDAWRRSGRGRL